MNVKHVCETLAGVFVALYGVTYAVLAMILFVTVLLFIWGV